MTVQMRKATGGALMALAVTLAIPSAATADDVADFYKGKTITINVGYGVGGGYDTLTRLMARRFGSFISESQLNAS